VGKISANDEDDDIDPADRHTCQIFIFAFERLDDVVTVVDRRPLSVDLGGVVTTVALRRLQLRLQVGHLAFPVINRFVELALALVRLRRDRLSLYSNFALLSNSYTQYIHNGRSACMEQPSCSPSQHRAHNGHFLQTSQNCFLY